MEFSKNGKGAHRSDRKAITPVACVDGIEIEKVSVPEGDCGREENDGYQ